MKSKEQIMYRLTVLLAFLLLISSSASAQTSASYKLEEYAFNNGGRPADGVVAASASFRITLDAIGDSVSGSQMSGATYSMEPGFGAAYTPPGPVSGLLFTSKYDLVWNPERSIGIYNLYRGSTNDLTGIDYGDCFQLGLTGETASDYDPLPYSGGYFYLVSAENRIGEEGPLGYDSQSAQRPNTAPCP